MTKKELIELLTELLGTLPVMVLRQIDKYVKDGLTYKEIGRSAYYIYGITKKVPLKSVAKFGIGLVPTYVREANDYFERIKKQQEQQAKQVESGKDIPNREVEPMKRIKRKRGININEL